MRNSLPSELTNYRVTSSSIKIKIVLTLGISYSFKQLLLYLAVLLMRIPVS